MKRLLTPVLVVASAVFGLAAAGNAETGQNMLAAVTSPAEATAPQAPVAALPVAGSEDSQAAYPDGITIQTGSLPAPSGLQCDADSTSIGLSWKELEGATEYRVLLGGVPWAIADSTSQRLQTLPTHTRFEIGVQASGDDGWGAPATQACTTAAEGATADSIRASASSTLPPWPSDFRCTGSTTSSITVNWKAVAGVDGYKITASLPINQFTSTLVRSTSEEGTTATLDGLMPFTSYIMAIRSVKNGKEGAGFGRPCSTKAAPPECRETSNSITLDWKENVKATSISVYQWYAARAATGTSYTDGRAVSGTTTSTTFTGLEPKTSYKFYLWRKYSSNGTWFQVLPSEMCTTEPPLKPPTGLACSAITTESITLTWASSSGATKYEAGFSPSNDPWKVTTRTSATFTKLAPNTEYTFHVRAGNNKEWSGNSHKRCRTEAVSPAPGACGAATTESVTLEWSAEEGVDMWFAARATTGDSYADGRKLDASITSTVFDGMTPGETYTLRLWWRPQQGADWVEVLPSAVCSTVILPAPTGLGCEASDTAIVLFWKEVAGATSYQASRADFPWSTVEAGGLSQKFTVLTADTSYAFRVRAGKAVGANTKYGDAATAMCSTPAAPLGAPTALVCTTSPSGASLRWGAVTGASIYRISSDGGATWAPTDALDSHTLPDLIPTAAHSVQVQAGNAAAWGGTASTKCPKVELPADFKQAPIGATCTAGIGFLDLRWNPVNAATRYRVSKDSGQTWAQTTDTALTLSGLTADTNYNSIRLQAGDDDSWDGTRAISCRTLPATALAAPKGLNCSASMDSITLTWNSVSEATRYRAGFGHTWVALPATAQEFVFGGLKAGTSYDVRVQAGNAGGWQSLAAFKPCSTTAASPQTPARACTPAAPPSPTLGQESAGGSAGSNAEHEGFKPPNRTATGAGSTGGQGPCPPRAEAPSNLTIACTANKKGPPTISATWDATVGADRYLVAITSPETLPGGTQQTALIAHYSGKHTAIIADGTHGTEYQAQTKARTAGGWTEWTPLKTASCSTSAPPLSPR